MTTIKISSLSPMVIELPSEGPYDCPVVLLLPPMRAKLIDLSMGGIIPDGPCIMADDAIRLEQTIGDEGNDPLPVEKIVQYLFAARGSLQDMIDIYQAELVKPGKGLLDKVR